MRLLAKSLSLLVFLGGMTVLRADTDKAPKPLSLSDMTSMAADLRAGIEVDQQKILVLQQKARKLKDVIKLNCVNDKLVEVKAQLNIADTANENLQVALQKNTDDRQGYFDTLTRSSEAVHRLREEAAGCIGAPELTKQESGVSVDRPEIPDDPMSNPYDPTGGSFEPPPYSSPPT